MTAHRASRGATGAPAGLDDREGQRRDLFVKLFDALDVAGTARLTALCVTLTVAVGLADYTAPPEVSFAVFYLVPVVLVAARGAHLLAGMVAGMAAAAWILADVLARPAAYTTPVIPLWNGVSRLLVFLVVAWLVTSLRRGVSLERELSRVDNLSGVANRRAFYEAVESELRRVRRTSAPITVAFLDIDDFKVVNDRLGHAEGDAVIRVMGEVLAARVRGTDVVARLGGDEFALLLPGASPDIASNVLERIHRELLDQARQRGWPLGFSVGAVTWGRPPASVDEMVARADEVMYEVKLNGKNSVRCTEAP